MLAEFPPAVSTTPPLLENLHLPRDTQGNLPVDSSLNNEGFLAVRFGNGYRLLTQEVWLALVPDVTQLRTVHPYHYEFADPALTENQLVISRPGAKGLGLTESGALEQLWGREAQLRLPSTAYRTAKIAQAAGAV